MASQDEWGQPNQDFGAPPAKQGMSCWVKLLILVVVLGGIAGVACCGFFMWAGKNMASDDPATIRAATDAMAEINIPAEFEPKMSMNLVFMKMVIYATDDGQGMLMLAQAADSIAQDRRQLERSMGDSMRQQGQGGEPVDIKESVTRDIEINGQVEQFQFAKVVGANSGTEYMQITGSFQGKSGLVLVIMRVPMDDYNEAEVENMLKSIK